VEDVVNKTEEDAPVINRPMCHSTLMDYKWADDTDCQAEWWECRHCGHTIEISRDYRES
jgi:hypothetical protein